MLPLELLDEVIDHSVVEVLSAQVSISGGRFDFENAILDGQNGDVEGAAAQIKDENIVLLAGR